MQIERAEAVGRYAFGYNSPEDGVRDMGPRLRQSSLDALFGAQMMATDPDALALLTWYSDTLQALGEQWDDKDDAI